MISETEIFSSTSSEEEYLTDDELEEYLENLKTKIPSFIVELLKNNLKNRRLTKSQLDRIVARITDLYLGKKPDDKKTEELMEKVNELSKKLDALFKVAAITSATKISEDIKKEISKLEEEEEEKVEPEPQEIEQEVEEVEEKVEPEPQEIEQEVEEKVEPEPQEIEQEVEEKVEPEPQPQEVEEKIPEKESTPDILSEITPTPQKKEGGIDMNPEIQEITDRKFRLEELPEDTLSTMLVFKWLEFLISRVGSNNLIDILDYYYNLGWISEKVVNRLMKVSKNMKYLNEGFRKPADKMIPEDHIISLLYIEKLAGRPIPIDELENIDREINRIKKWAEELQFI